MFIRTDEMRVSPDHILLDQRRAFTNDEQNTILSRLKNHLWRKLRPHTFKYDYRYNYEYEYVRPKISDELKKWFEDNKIEYELCGVENYITKEDMEDFWSRIGIKFSKNSDAVLFKLRWYE